MALIERVVPGMRERGFGRVVSVGSSAVREPIPGLMLSNSHRAALLGALKTLSREVARDGVTVNSVLPGRIATDRIVQTAGSREAAEDGVAPGADRPPRHRRGVRRGGDVPLLGEGVIRDRHRRPGRRRTDAERLAAGVRRGGP